MEAENPGKSRIAATLPSGPSMRRGSAVGGRDEDRFDDDVDADVGQRREAAASRRRRDPEASIFVARLPRSTTSPKSSVDLRHVGPRATWSAPMKFCRPSLRVREMGICEPVTTTGLPKDGSRKESADDV